MILLPVSHDDGLVRRVPWVSIGIFGICVALQAHSCAVTPELERQAETLETEMFQLQQQAIEEYQASLTVKDRRKAHDALIEKLAQGGTERDTNRVLLDAYEDAPRKFRAGELTRPGDPRFARYQELKAQVQTLKQQVPAMRFGYKPAVGGFGHMLSAMFAHGGWVHLLGNMWFLYLVGCNLEDRWGRWQFLLFYLVAGCIAALTFAVLHKGSSTPLVGASGALAGAMGAFMVCFARTKVKMFYFFFLMFSPRWGTFRASAWIVLAIWVLEQLAMTYVEVSSGATQVAHSAHAGGFVFGAVIAFLLTRMGVDAQLEKISEHVADVGAGAVREHPLYLEAVELHHHQRDSEAVERLVQLIEQAPDHVQAHEQLLSIGLVARDLRAVDFGLPFLIEHYDRTRAHEPLVLAYRDLRHVWPDYGLTDQELLRVATAASHRGEDQLVIRAVGELLQQHPTSPLQPRALWLASQSQARGGSTDLQRDTLKRIVGRFPEHACAALAREQLGRAEVAV